MNKFRKWLLKILVPKRYMARFELFGNDKLCGFCFEHKKVPVALIAGPVCHICVDCVAICNGIIDEELKRQSEGEGE